MPYCKISPELSLWYITNSPNNNVASFDKSKPTILLLHPVALDSSWLRAQFQDPRFTNAFNMIAFDQRNMGRTRTPYTPLRDSYVEAADLGFAFELLQLPPVHVFAVQLNSTWMACRFALLFPSKCLSLCLASVPADVPLDWTPKAFMDLIQIWCFPPDLETFEQALLEMSHFQFAGQISTALEDEVTEFWSINMPPRKRRAVVELTIGRCPPTDKEYSQITVPTLLLTGDRSVAHPVKEAAKTNEKIKDSQLYVIKGAPENFTILPHFTSISHRVYASFLARQPPPPPFTPSRPDLKKVAKEALARLAELREDPSIASRDPSTTLSFSMWSPETVAANQGFLDQMAADENTAFLPTDSKGQPIRKFSARHDDQWTWAGFSVKPESMETVKGISIRSS